MTFYLATFSSHREALTHMWCRKYLHSHQKQERRWHPHQGWKDLRWSGKSSCLLTSRQIQTSQLDLIHQLFVVLSNLHDFDFIFPPFASPAAFRTGEARTSKVPSQNHRHQRRLHAAGLGHRGERTCASYQAGQHCFSCRGDSEVKANKRLKRRTWPFLRMTIPRSFSFRRFDEKLKLALAINVCGTKEILTLAKEMENLNVSCRSNGVFSGFLAVDEFA